jgi:hypothetical protein
MNKGVALMLAGTAVLGLSFLAWPCAGFAQVSDAEYVRQALAAGPEAVAKNATVVRPEPDGSMRTIRQGTNEFTCLIMGTDRMCADKNSMEGTSKNSPTGRAPQNRLRMIRLCSRSDS